MADRANNTHLNSKQLLLVIILFGQLKYVRMQILEITKCVHS